MRPTKTFLTACLCAGLLFPALCRAQAQEERASGTEEPAPHSGSFSPLFLALAATALPIVVGSALVDKSEAAGTSLILAGVFVGPSVGQFYIGSVGHGWAGIGARSAGGVIGIFGLALALSDAYCGVDGECSQDHGGLPVALTLGGALLYAGGALYSLFDTPLFTHHEGDSDRNYGFAPTLAPDPKGGWSKGMSAWVRF